MDADVLTLASHQHAGLFALQQVSSEYVRDTKIEVAQFLRDLLKHSRIAFRRGKVN